ncbi:LysE family translocator [Salinisphaera sp. USBA-960]|uniref:LysE family translocator n=1 Tax=Salinisphaera orenii TaxID=856731 RepID=UPI000DBE57D8|nr:LysE family translocator [Salifodinibacter halophilus]NNC25426.1 LysE family translocator [Salifodinibacter halophilus]
MINTAALSVFVPTFFLVSLTPGLCMTLSMGLGMTVGVRRTLWMMAGELAGVALTATLAAVGVAAIILHYPAVFEVFKWVGGAYLVYLGVMMWRAETTAGLDKAAADESGVSRGGLVSQGFITAVANPKGWAFDIALLPPFIDQDQAVVPQLVVLVSILLVIELVCLLLYAAGGQTAKRLLKRADNVQLLNRVAGTLICGVGVWLAIG